MLCVATMLTGSCKSRSTDAQSTSSTGTIKLPKPSVAPPPAANSDDALTQTIDIEDSRSVAEGGTAADKTTAKTGTAVAPTRKTVTKPKAAVRKQK
ncbi:MAG TPA: hypothetical protein VF505_01935 [Thermoanaerobaculia bacterium]